MAELIQKQDTLNEGRVKINAAITDAEQAKITSDGADTKATQALANSESTQTQLDTIVINGDSSVEAAQARVDEKGVGHTTLKDRIDDGFTKVTSQLNETNSQLAQNIALIDDIAINIESFPKKETDIDDTERIQRAVDYCITNKKVLLFPYGGRYIARQVNVEAGLRVMGYGAVVTLAPNQPKATRLFTTQNRKWISDKDSSPLIIEGLTLDGNCWNQGEFQNFEKEQQFGIMLVAGSTVTPTKGYLKAKIINCHFQNWCADGVHVYIQVDAEITGCSSDDCFRGGVVVSGSPSDVKITNFTGKSTTMGKVLDIEVDTPASSKITIDSLFAYGGVDIGTKEGSTVSINKMFIYNGTLNIVGFKQDITIDNSRLEKTIIINSTNCKINNSNIIIKPSTTNEVIGVYAWVVDSNNLLPKDAYYTEFNNCTFERSDKYEPVTTEYDIIAIKGYFGKIAINNCNIGNGIKKGFYNYGVQYSYVKSTIFDCDTGIYFWPLSWTPIFYMEVDNMQTGKNLITPIHFQTHLSSGPHAVVEFKNTILSKEKSSYVADLGFGSTIFSGSRTIYIDTDPNTLNVPAIRGDVAKLYNPIAGQPCEWIATTSNNTKATWKISKTLSA